MTKRRFKRPADPAEIMASRLKKMADDERRYREMEWGISEESVALAQARGDVVTEFPIGPGEREKPRRKLCGLDWLNYKNRLTSQQWGAGLKYGDDFRQAEDVHVRSNANMDRFGGDGTTGQQIRMEARDRLNKTRREGLNGHAGMIELCDLIAGEGKRIRDLARNEAETQKKEAVFITALDLLAKHYGMLPK